MSDNSPMEDPKAGKPEKKEIIIDMGGSFSSGGRPVWEGNSDSAAEGNRVDKAAIEFPMGGPGENANENYNMRYEVLQKASTQIPEDSFNYGTDMDDLAEPPYNMDRLANLNEISYVRNSCISAIAQNTTGLGFQIKKLDPQQESVDADEISKKITAKLEEWAARDGKTFTELMYAVKYDEETVGNGYIEVSRNRRGEIDGLYHLPGQTIRVRRDKAGYVQERGNTKVPFYRFGDKVKILSDGSISWLPDRDPDINELIQFKLYSPRNTYYGIPRDVATIVTIAGDEMARNHNIKYFTHSAIPDLLLVFSVNEKQIQAEFGDQPVKVEVPDELRESVYYHFRKNITSQNFEPGLFYLPMGVDMKVEKISQGQRDSGWVNYRTENRNEIRMAFRVPPVMIGDTSAGGYSTAAIEKSIFLEQVIQPEQNRYAQRLMGILWPEMLGIRLDPSPPIVEEDGSLRDVVPDIDIAPPGGVGIDPNIWVLTFKQMAISDQVSMAQIHNIYGGTLGILTKNEMRADIGRAPLDDGDVAEPAADASAPPSADPPDPNDLRGIGHGRGAAGAVTLPQPRRGAEEGVPTPANLNSVDNPLAKRDESGGDLSDAQWKMVETELKKFADDIVNDVKRFTNHPEDGDDER